MYDPARFLPYFSHTLNVAGGPGPYLQIVRGDPNRIYLAITNVTGSNIFLWPVPPTADAEGFIAIGPLGSYELFYTDHGLMVSQPWWVSGTAPTLRVYTIEMGFSPPVAQTWVAG